MGKAIYKVRKIFACASHCAHTVIPLPVPWRLHPCQITGLLHQRHKHLHYDKVEILVTSTFAAEHMHLAYFSLKNITQVSSLKPYIA